MDETIPTPAIFAGSLARTFEYHTAGVHYSPEIRWTWTAPGEITGPILINQGVVYLVDDHGSFSALEAASGKLLWSFQGFQGKYCEAVMCIEGNRGYVATSSNHNLDGETNLFEVDLSTGHLLCSWKRGTRWGASELLVWKQFLVVTHKYETPYMIDLRTGEFTEGNFANIGGLDYTPVVYQDTIYGLYYFNNNESVFVVQALVQNEIPCWSTWGEQDEFGWDDENPEEQRYISPVDLNGSDSLLVANETLFAVGDLYSEDESKDPEENLLIALDPATGRVKWSYEPGPDSILAAAAGLLFLHTKQRIEALDIQTRQSRWLRETSATVRNSFIADGLLYVLDRREQMTALDIYTGEERWQRSIEEIDIEFVRGGWPSLSSIADGTLYLTSGRTLYALS